MATSFVTAARGRALLIVSVAAVATAIGAGSADAAGALDGRVFNDSFYPCPGHTDSVSYTHLTLPTTERV